MSGPGLRDDLVDRSTGTDVQPLKAHLMALATGPMYVRPSFVTRAGHHAHALLLHPAERQSVIVPSYDSASAGSVFGAQATARQQEYPDATSRYGPRASRPGRVAADADLALTMLVPTTMPTFSPVGVAAHDRAASVRVPRHQHGDQRRRMPTPASRQKMRQATSADRKIRSQVGIERGKHDHRRHAGWARTRRGPPASAFQRCRRH